jgi:hypothetical protein
MVRSALMSDRYIAAFCLIVLACTADDSPRRSDTSANGTCDWSPSTRLTSDGVAALEIGLPAAEVRHRCELVSDSIETLAEGQPVRVMRVKVGPSVVRAEVVDDTLWRLTISDSLIRTADGLGVGTTVGTLLTSNPSWVATGETGAFVGLVPHCGLSFRLDTSTPGLPRPWILRDTAALRRAPPETRVNQVLVVGSANCNGRG